MLMFPRYLTGSRQPAWIRPRHKKKACYVSRVTRIVCASLRYMPARDFNIRWFSCPLPGIAKSLIAGKVCFSMMWTRRINPLLISGPKRLMSINNAQKLSNSLKVFDCSMCRSPARKAGATWFGAPQPVLPTLPWRGYYIEK